jgi:uncharacterized membrane protein
MNDPNPYDAPQSALESLHPDLDTGFLGEPRDVAAGAAMEWLGTAWGYFTRDPGTWIGIMLLSFLVMFAAGMVPFLGGLIGNVLMIVLIGGMMLGCEAQRRQEPLTVAHLFAGFSTHFTPLLVVGLLYLAATAVLVIAMLVVMFAGFGGMAAFEGQLQDTGPGSMVGVVAAMVLVVVALTIPLTMAIVFAPALVVFNGLSPTDAMAMSFRACARNFAAVVVWGMLAVLVSVVAILPCGLGLLVAWPLLTISTYAGYRDLFYAPA